MTSDQIDAHRGGEDKWDSELAELEYLASADYPLWGGHLLRGEPISAPEMKRWLRDGLIEAVEQPRVGYIITKKGRVYIEQKHAHRGGEDK